MLANQAQPNDESNRLFRQVSEWIDSAVEVVANFLKENFGPPLKSLHEPIDTWLGSLPMSVAMICAIGLYAVAVIWVWTLRKEFVYRGAPDRKPWRDLRVWATLVTIPYVIIYLWLGR